MIHAKTVVTGGAGFIGSHLTEKLLKQGNKVTVIDNLSSGKLENIQHLVTQPLFKLVQEDLKKPVKLHRIIDEAEIIFHFAANPEVRVRETTPKTHFEENILATFNLLESIRQTEKPKILVFASTSTVYGEASSIPTDEESPLMPISTYGASKLACEALIMSYASTFDKRALIIRLANVVGPRSNHGVIPDLIKKIDANPEELEILGDGNQEKSYVYIDDCVDATTHLVQHFLAESKKFDIYNLGSADRIRVREIAKIIAREKNTPEIKLVFVNVAEGGRGWKGDVKTMQLSINKILQTGWKPRYASRKAVELATQSLIAG